MSGCLALRRGAFGLPSSYQGGERPGRPDRSPSASRIDLSSRADKRRHVQLLNPLTGAVERNLDITVNGTLGGERDFVMCDSERIALNDWSGHDTKILSVPIG